MAIHFMYASKKQIRSWDDDNDTMAFSLYNPKTKDHQIVFPYRASTRTRLHEIAHCVMGHCKQKVQYIGEHIKSEIEAEIWANDKCGKIISIEALLNIAKQAICYNGRTNYIFHSMATALENQGFRLDRARRSKLWFGILALKEESKQDD